MKDFPLDIDSIYHKKPDPTLEYYTCRSMAIIGGQSPSVNDIVERILLVNSFIEQFEKIFLVGEIGLVALHSLEIYPGKVERDENNLKQYESLKEFMLKVLNKAIDRGCQVKIPIDFICAKKEELDDIIKEVARGPSQSDLKAEEEAKKGTDNT